MKFKEDTKKHLSEIKEKEQKEKKRKKKKKRPEWCPRKYKTDGKDYNNPGLENGIQ
jgi:hypothetical protein